MRIIIYLGILLFVLCSVTASAEGFTVSSVSYVKNNHDANVTMELVIDGAGQSVSGVWSGAGLLSNVTMSQPLKIEVRNNTEKLIYPFINQNTLFKYHAYYVDADNDGSAQCPAKPAFCYPVDTDRMGRGLDRIIVVERQAVGSYAAFGNPEISHNIELSIIIGDKEYRQSIGTGQDSRGTAVFRTVDNYWLANARYTGMAMTGRSWPNQNLYIGTHADGKEWHIANKVTFDDYVESQIKTDLTLQTLQDKLPEEFDQVGYVWRADYVNPTIICKDTLCSDVVNLVNLHNAEVDKLLSQNIRIDYGSPMATQETVIRDGNVYDTLNQPIGYGHVVLTLSAEEIGIVSLSGKPQIEDITVSNYSSGDNSGILTVTIKNIGNTQGTFGVRINDSTEQKITLEQNAIGSVNLPIISIQEGLNYGNVQVYDLVSGDSDTKSYQINVSAPKRFIPNESSVYNNAKMQNSNDGMTQNTTMDCPNGIWDFVNGTYICTLIKDIPEPTPPVKMQYQIPIPTPAPPHEESNTLWISAIVLLVGIIIGLMITGGRSKKGHRAIILFWIVTAIGVMIVVGVLIYPAISEKIKEIQFLMNLYEKLR